MAIRYYFLTLFTLSFIICSCGGEEDVVNKESTVERRTLEEDSLETDSSEVLKVVNELQFTDAFEERYGQGIVVLSFTEDVLFNLYPRAPEGDHPFILYPSRILSITVSEYELDLGTFTEGEWEMFAFYPEYDLVHAICLRNYHGLQESPYEEMSLIRFNDEYNYGIDMEQAKFYSWADYLTEFAFSVSPKNDDGLYDGEIYNAASLEAEAITQQEDYGTAWVPIEVRGKWMKIEVYEGACQEGEVRKVGWIQWRDDSKLLIDISYIC